MIELDRVTKEYRHGGPLSRRKAGRGVVDLSFSIPEGAYGLLGINGAGKTTTLKMIGTLLRPTSGRVLVDGIDTVAGEKQLRRRINMITGSDRMLYFRLTGRENLLYFASLYGMSRREASSRAGELLELTGLTETADERVERYSRGMKQRLSIARGLINNPSLLLLDEPTLGLDVAIAREIRTFIREGILGTPGRTVILTSNYMDEIEEICPRVGILNEGRLIYEGDLPGLYRRIGLAEVHRFSIPAEHHRQRERLSRLAGIPVEWSPGEDGFLEFSLPPEKGFELLKNMDSLEFGGWRYSQEKPCLEEALVRLVGEGAV